MRARGRCAGALSCWKINKHPGRGESALPTRQVREAPRGAGVEVQNAAY